MIQQKRIGTVQGKDLYEYRFTNKSGAEMVVSNYGAIIKSITMPDRNGHFDDVVLGYDDMQTYVQNNSNYFGCIIGRYGNRIKNGTFQIDGTTYQLGCNEGENHHHGGFVGFHQRMWEGEIDGDSLVLSYTSPAGEERYPGTLQAQVRYSLTDDNAVELDYTARTDADTVVNLTNHSYFNLNGGAAPIYDHTLWMDADTFIPTDGERIPTGEFKDVTGTPFDFRKARRLGDGVLDDKDEDIVIGSGYDHTIMVNGSGLRKAAEVCDPVSGRCMEVVTDQPGIQFFSGRIIQKGTKGLRGKLYGPHYGLCLEPQVPPNSPNEERFPDCVLRKGETYRHMTRYVFSVKE